MYALSILFLFISTFSFAQLKHAPPAFNSKMGHKAVFVDFKTARYKINYDVQNKMATAESTIDFEMPEDGFVVFDMVTDPTEISLDGLTVEQALITTPYNESQIRILKTATKAGNHTLKIISRIIEGVKFDSKSVSSAFWTSDLDDRNYLEQYLPTNYEYDQYKIFFEITSNGADPQDIATNGSVKAVGINHFEVEFPEYFTTSSIFFHTFPMGKFSETKFEFNSISGKNIPVRIYSGTGILLKAAKSKALNTLKELERDYGAFPHQSITIYLAGSGGMEYCGATMSDIGALDHELTHSYFARGMLPANGNAGWMDEAIASWRDDGYKNLSEEKLYTTIMAGHPVYTRKTDTDAYDSGARFMAYLNHLVAKKGGFKQFLKHIIDTRLFQPLTTEDFHEDFEKFYGLDVNREYLKYIYGKNGNSNPQIYKLIENPKHQKMSVKEMQNFL